MGPLAEKQGARFTYGDHLKWDDGERWELIDGVAYNMTSTPSRFHQQISGELSIQFGNFLRNTPGQMDRCSEDSRCCAGRTT